MAEYICYSKSMQQDRASKLQTNYLKNDHVICLYKLMSHFILFTDLQCRVQEGPMIVDQD